MYTNEAYILLHMKNAIFETGRNRFVNLSKNYSIIKKNDNGVIVSYTLDDIL